MESKLAQQARQDLIAEAQQLAPEERFERIPGALPADDGAFRGRAAAPNRRCSTPIVRTTGAGQSALLLLDAVEILTTHKIDYAVVGAVAASVHGIVRASFDADLHVPR